MPLTCLDYRSAIESTLTFVQKLWWNLAWLALYFVTYGAAFFGFINICLLYIRVRMIYPTKNYIFVKYTAYLIYICRPPGLYRGPAVKCLIQQKEKKFSGQHKLWTQADQHETHVETEFHNVSMSL